MEFGIEKKDLVVLVSEGGPQDGERGVSGRIECAWCVESDMWLDCPVVTITST